MDTKNLHRETSTYNPYSLGKGQQGLEKQFKKTKRASRCAVCQELLKNKQMVIEMSPRYYGHSKCVFAPTEGGA